MNQSPLSNINGLPLTTMSEVYAQGREFNWEAQLLVNYDIDEEFTYVVSTIKDNRLPFIPNTCREIVQPAVEFLNSLAQQHSFTIQALYWHKYDCYIFSTKAEQYNMEHFTLW